MAMTPKRHSSAAAAAPTYFPQDFDNGHWGVQSWLERTAWRTLAGTAYGRPAQLEAPHQALFEDPLLQKVYLMDLALFVGAERVSYLAAAGMVRCAPDELTQIQLGTQVLDECRHYEVFCRIMAEMGVPPERRVALVERYTTPALRKFYDLLLEQVDRQDFFASSIAQNIVMEGMAYPIYRYEIKYWSRIDPGLSRAIQGAFADEVHHVGFGEAVNTDHIRRASPEGRARVMRLMAQFHTLMSEVFEEIVRRYIGLYQACADQYLDVVGDVEIFPGRTLGTISEEEQARTLLKEIQREHQERLGRLGLG